ncbi:Protein CBG06909 [Caenorhabditis briggsae]|uniref:Protein CBG06909 n=1 Tax=Caenorhabditis briggsae TaxID=6238 RepID=A8X3C3_CAEBR|nr:Protein CBG06909 [Caenorhabditis briggsae]CAP27133.2 Protein CBG06909 [Caenorhabditis briggsae]
MDKTAKKHPVGLLETKSLASALPEKNAEGRPKYTQILTPSKSSSASNGDAVVAPTSVEKKTFAKQRQQRSNNNKQGIKNANNQKPRGIFLPATEKRPFNLLLKRQEVVARPTDIKLALFQLLLTIGPRNFLSAIYPCKITVDGNEYNSVEHFYQACKLYTLVGQEKAAELKASESPIEVKKATKVLLKEANITSKKVEEWKEKDSIGVLKHVVTHKFTQNEALKEKLLETGDKILIQAYIGDTFFATGASFHYVSEWVSRHVNQDLVYPEEVTAENFKYLPLVANGKNVFGWILMQVRDELRAQSSA